LPYKSSNTRREVCGNSLCWGDAININIIHVHKLQWPLIAYVCCDVFEHMFQCNRPLIIASLTLATRASTSCRMLALARLPVSDAWRVPAPEQTF
jgi:hypothetical protein